MHLLLLIISLLIIPEAGAQTLEPKPKDILSMVPGAKGLKHITNPIDCYRLLDSKGNPVGAAVMTNKVPPEIGGYRDEISLLVGVDESGAITGVKLLAHQEDNGHINLILSKGFLGRFTKRSPTESWDDIETITGATISSGAMREDIRTATLAVVEKVIKSGVLSQKVKSPSALITFDKKRFFTTGNIGVLSLIAFSIVAVLMPGRRILRSASLLFSFVLIGVLFNTPITIGNFLDVGYGIVPGLNNIALFALFIFAIVSSLMKGPLYCSYLCPFGAMQDGVSAFGLPKCKISERWMKSAGLFRWIILFTIIIAVVGFNVFAFRNFEPFALCFAPDAGGAVWIQAGIILAAALFLRRPWCRLFCPTGLVIETLSRLGTKIRLAVKKERKCAT